MAEAVMIGDVLFVLGTHEVDGKTPVRVAEEVGAGNVEGRCATVPTDPAVPTEEWLAAGGAVLGKPVLGAVEIGAVGVTTVPEAVGGE